MHKISIRSTLEWLLLLIQRCISHSLNPPESGCQFLVVLGDLPALFCSLHESHSVLAPPNANAAPSDWLTNKLACRLNRFDTGLPPSPHTALLLTAAAPDRLCCSTAFLGRVWSARMIQSHVFVESFFTPPKGVGWGRMSLHDPRYAPPFVWSI